MTTPTADITQLQQLISQLQTDYGTEEAAQGQQQSDLLKQLSAAQSQLATAQSALTADQSLITAAQAQHAADLNQHGVDLSTIAQLQAQIAALTGPQAPIPGYTILGAHDEFDGSSVDRTKWNVRNGWVGGNESSICWDHNVTVSGGMLVIQPQREVSTASTSKGPVTRQYTSGYINSLFDIPKGSYTEFRQRLPLKPGVSAGMWPADWFRLDVGLLEIDLMEAWGTPSLRADTSGKFQAAVGPDTDNVNANGYHGWYDVPPQDLTQWHTYGLRVDLDGSLTFYYDGKPTPYIAWNNGVKTVVTTLTPAMLPALAWDPAKDKLRIRLNLQIGQPTYYGDPTTATDFTQHFDTDYVRNWLKAA